MIIWESIEINWQSNVIWKHKAIHLNFNIWGAFHIKLQYVTRICIVKLLLCYNLAETVMFAK